MKICILDKHNFFKKEVNINVNYDIMGFPENHYTTRHIETTSPLRKAKWDFEEKRWRYPDIEPTEWNGAEWVYPEVTEEAEEINSNISSEIIERMGTVEIVSNQATGNGYFEGWQDVTFAEVSNVMNVQVTACDVAGKAVYESATVANITNGSMSIGVFSKEQLDKPIKVYWLVKGK